MVSIIYTKNDLISDALGKKIISSLSIKHSEDVDNFTVYTSKSIKIIELTTDLLTANIPLKLIDDRIIFLSRHVSSKGVMAFTVHPLGIFDNNIEISDKIDIGIADPLGMCSALQSMNIHCIDIGPKITYEATHHGPILQRRSSFIEFGGPLNIENIEKFTDALANSVLDSIDRKATYERIVIGISGTHYPSKFTTLAIAGKYAFAHILTKNNLNEKIIKGAFEASNPIPDAAVIEWKGLKSEQRNYVINILNELGIEYIRI